MKSRPFAGMKTSTLTCAQFQLSNENLAELNIMFLFINRLRAGIQTQCMSAVAIKTHVTSHTALDLTTANMYNNKKKGV